MKQSQYNGSWLVARGSWRSLLSKFLLILSKIIVSGVFTLTILTSFCFLYYNLHQHYVDIDGATDYVLEANKFASKATEGFAYFKTNNEGYNNSFDYKNGMEINALIMGSSHMEATNVMMSYNTANILRKLYDNSIYNIGISGHDFLRCAANLVSALKKYRPSKYVVIETSSIHFPDKELSEVLENRLTKLPAYDKGLLSALRKNNFLRLMYAQFFKDFFKKYVVKTQNQNSETVAVSNNNEMTMKLLQKLGKTALEFETKLIIAYHPSVSLSTDGTLKINSNPEDVKQFSDLCSQNGIYFLDVGERFLKEYEKNYTLPYGFTNTSVGRGHMNKYGHKMFAEEIYKLMQKIEAQS